MGLVAVAKKKFKVTTDSEHHLPVYGNVLNRDFSTTSINQKWACDTTYIRTQEGWLYLAVVIDLYSRAVISWPMSKRMKKSLVCDASMMALFKRKFPKNVIVHSDRGSQYCSKKYQSILKDYRFIGSMSRKANCWGRVENWRAHYYNNHVSSPRSSNRTCAANASGFRSKYHAFALDTSAMVCGIA